MNYKELLKHPKWQKKRLEILQDRDWRCEACFNEERCLHVHHKKYIYGNKPWEYEDDNFVVLCEVCHFDVECLKLEERHDEKVRKELEGWFKSEEFEEWKHSGEYKAEDYNTVKKKYDERLKNNE